MTQNQRFYSIDILKGISVLLMLFAGALYLPAQLPWFVSPATTDAISVFTGFIITGFIFTYGMTIPFSITKKINNGLTSYDISRAIFGRTIVLIAIGLLMVNTYRVNAELTGFNSYIWSILMFTAIFLVWNRYTESENNFFTIIGFRFLGMALLVFLVFKFKSGSFENGGSLITGWWEIPGLIGWGYLVAAFSYLALRNSLPGTFIIWIIFLALSILSNLKLTDFMEPVRPYLGVVTDGKIPFIMLTGQMTGILVKKFFHPEISKTISRITAFGLFSVILGIILKLIIPGLAGFQNPTVTLIFSGIWIIVFLLLFWLTDVKMYFRFFAFLKPAGENTMTAYLFPYLIYNIIWLTGIPIFFYRQEGNPFYTLVGSAIAAIVMMLFSTLIIKLNIRLKI
jgi:heparan-alpha-glucosaminide N-acetyltransferase